ncbi:phage recombination protein Bet [Alkalithermobacter thermoalcaliphilus JW-YL-7 = DSM 7308]|uniref:Phage recombination protein Bet n=1 Tax=Alkalithermobacter thermoalcaliphilus JW-YL-7 = DSM 7308 TaxID=1121328 RepID=A0A150FSN2_CLOPD|nr:phage recombination protein Bet [[Clostridium] paradoxum JW-YL-7 = DSM 7308]SHL12673.1 phage recombination protein Bet [[Clostridium] paradoxum JW-YL-7 = DSM 7308]
MEVAIYETEHGKVELTPDIIKRYLVSGDSERVTDQEVMMFLNICKYQKLNPFLREAYLIKFGNSPANIVVGKDTFTKRAYRNPRYNGIKAGIVILNRQGESIYREGSLKAPGEQLIGGWAEVYLKDTDIPVRAEVSMEEYAKKQATWNTMPATMIRKVALVQALREAFPEDLQGLYDQAEMPNVPDKLPEKEVIPGGATKQQKIEIVKLAELKGLYDSAIKDTSKLEEFCKNNGYDLKKLKYEEVGEVMKLLSEYEQEEVIEAEIVEE